MNPAPDRKLYMSNYNKDRRRQRRGVAAVSAHPATPRTPLSIAVTEAIDILGANLNMATLAQLIATDNRFVNSRQIFLDRTPLETRNINNVLSKRRVKLHINQVSRNSAHLIMFGSRLARLDRMLLLPMCLCLWLQMMKRVKERMKSWKKIPGRIRKRGFYNMRRIQCKCMKLLPIQTYCMPILSKILRQTVKVRRETWK
jgi:hypothetical protein